MMLTEKEIEFAETFVEKAYDGSFRKIATPAICAFISNAIAHIREQDKALAEARRLFDRLSIHQPCDNPRCTITNDAIAWAIAHPAPKEG